MFIRVIGAEYQQNQLLKPYWGNPSLVGRL